MVQKLKAVANGIKPLMLTGVLLFLGSGMSAYATTVNFNFGPTNLSNNAGPSAIQTYMNTALGLQGAGTVIVSPGAVAQNGPNAYAGEGYVVGQTSATTTAYTLATNGDGGFLMNNDLNINNAGTFHEFDLTFSKAVDSISFDYEIFPDATGTATNLPDMQLVANGTAIAPFPVNAAVPFHMHSVNSGMGSYETHPQLGPTPSGTLVLNIAGGKLIQFIDWPPEIGIAKLSVTFHTPPSGVPEPASIVLLGSCLLGSLTVIRRRMRNTA